MGRAWLLRVSSMQKPCACMLMGGRKRGSQFTKRKATFVREAAANHRRDADLLRAPSWSTLCSTFEFLLPLLQSWNVP